MPRLGEPFEPARFEGFAPWWREISALEKERARPSEAPGRTELAAEHVEWPID